MATAEQECHEGQWPTVLSAKGVTQAVSDPAVGVEVWCSTYLEVPTIPGGAIFWFAFYFVSKERT